MSLVYVNIVLVQLLDMSKPNLRLYIPAMVLANDFSHAYILISLIQVSNSFIILTYKPKTYSTIH